MKVNDESLEVFFHDLDEESRQRVLRFYGIAHPEDMNLGDNPLFILTRNDELDVDVEIKEK